MRITRTTPADQLRYAIKDAQEAIDAMPDGPNVGRYLDEQHACMMELNRRRKANRNAKMKARK